MAKILLKSLRFGWGTSHSGLLHDQSLILVCFIQHQKSSVCAGGANQVMLLSRNKLELQFALEPESWFGHGRKLKYGLSFPPTGIVVWLWFVQRCTRILEIFSQFHQPCTSVFRTRFIPIHYKQCITTQISLKYLR